MKLFLMGLLIFSLAMPGYADDLSYLVKAYKAEAKRLKEIEENKAEERQDAIEKAEDRADDLAKAVKKYQDSVDRYQQKYIAPTKTTISKKKEEVQNLRNKITEYEKGLQKAVDEQRFAKRGAMGAISGEAYGAADYKDLIKGAKSSLDEAEKKQKELEANLAGYEQRKGEYEKVITDKQKEVEAAKSALNGAQDELSNQKVASSELLTASVGPSLNTAIGTMIQKGKNSSLEAEMLLRDLDNLATKLGVDAGDLKHVFAQHPELREKIANTALGGYVNSQIANAMGSVCEYQNMCAAKGAEDVNKISPDIVKKSMGHLYDKNRGAEVIKALGEQKGRDVATEGETLGK